MGIKEVKTEVKTFNVYAKCDKPNCTGTFILDEPGIIWDNNGTKGDLSDDSFIYAYKCDICGDKITSDIKYPNQEFVEI